MSSGVGDCGSAAVGFFFLGIGYFLRTVLLMRSESETSFSFATSFKWSRSSGLKYILHANNGTAGDNADVNKENAVAGIYTDENNNVSVVLLKDYTETARIQPAADMTINLGGHILTFENDYYGIACVQGDNTITIDGQLSGSQMVLNGIDGGGVLIAPRTNTVIINGGTYTTNESVANEDYHAAVVSVVDGGTAFITGCDIVSKGSNEARGYGVYIETGGSVTISDCNITAYANYFGDENGYKTNSIGILNYGGNLTINDCYIMGTHSGVSNYGTIYVNGGTYEGYGHGGLYFSNTGKTSYVQNATIRECAMPDGYTTNLRSNHSGFYIGGANDRDNISVHMDNCDIYGSTQPIVLRGTAGEQNNTLYISNSRINKGTERGIRIDNSTHKLYLGIGNNFTIEDCRYAPEGAENSIIITNETYTHN